MRPLSVKEFGKAIEKRGNIEDREMYKALNMGIGMVLVLSKKDACEAVDILERLGLKSYIIGKVVKGNRQVKVK